MWSLSTGGLCLKVVFSTDLTAGKKVFTYFTATLVITKWFVTTLFTCWNVVSSRYVQRTIIGCTVPFSNESELVTIL
jgi:hypothetical protein